MQDPKLKSLRNTLMFMGAVVGSGLFMLSQLLLSKLIPLTEVPVGLQLVILLLFVITGTYTGYRIHRMDKFAKDSFINHGNDSIESALGEKHNEKREQRSKNRGQPEG